MTELRWKCFYLTRTFYVRVGLRRLYIRGPEPCPNHPYHEAIVSIEAEAHKVLWLDRTNRILSGVTPPDSDPRWPKTCAYCPYEFSGADVSQLCVETLYRGCPDGKLYTLHDAPIGALWDASWFHGSPEFCGADGLCIVCRTPGGDWMIDSEASNCTKKGDPTHKCWCRHGDPRTGNLHVDKACDTCGAGSGSIQAGPWHGFLEHGYLVQR